MNQYHVVMEVAPKYWQRPETLNDIYVHSPTGNEVPLSAFRKFYTSSTLCYLLIIKANRLLPLYHLIYYRISH